MYCASKYNMNSPRAILKTRIREGVEVLGVGTNSYSIITPWRGELIL